MHFSRKQERKKKRKKVALDCNLQDEADGADGADEAAARTSSRRAQQLCRCLLLKDASLRIVRVFVCVGAARSNLGRSLFSSFFFGCCFGCFM